MSHYDVIVIGSGAGGGTLVRHLAPSGKRILLLERGGWLPREPQNWQAQDVFVDGRYVSPDTWYYADLTPFAAAGPLLRRRRDQVVRRRALPPASRGLRRASARRRDLAGVADLLRGDRALLHARPSSCTRSTAPAARTRPSRRRALPTRTLRCHTSRASSSSQTTWPRPAYTRSTRRAGSSSTRATCPTANACGVTTATASRASCTPSPTPR